jgi:AcrR family transcriptional regulator
MPKTARPKIALPKPVRPKRRPARRLLLPKPYHHGDLRRVLIDAALQLAEQGGAAAVSVRETARRAGVSPGAPFRHFESRTALMTAVAEEAQRRFRTEIDAALAQAPRADPLARFRALGLAYLRWAMRNPAHFEIISSGKYFDHDQAAALSRDNAEVIGMTERILAEAAALGQLRSADLKRIQIAGRALVYGFARMNLDGHFPRWGIAEREAEQTAEAVLDVFIAGIARGPQTSS